jgi:hypothetical protein
LLLEIRFRIEERLLRPLQQFELPEPADFLHRPLEVFLMVSHEKKLSARHQRPPHRCQKFHLHQPPSVVAQLRPRIRAQQMQPGDLCLGQQPLDHVAAVQPKHPRVVQAPLRELFANLAHPA